MRAIIIGAGRGRRLMPTTEHHPKCFAEVKGKRILDWCLEAFAANGIDEVCFVGGYRIEVVRERYPRFTFRHNKDWENNNILESLMHAGDLMDEPFICCYSDTLFSPRLVAGLLEAANDITLSADMLWADRYRHRTQHPPDDAEKITASGGRVTRVHRGIDPGEAHGGRVHGGRHPGGLRTRPDTFEGRRAMNTMLFPTSVVGSMPRSAFVRDLIAAGPDEISADDCEKRMDAAVRYIVAVQEQAGLDVLTDGEWRRKSYIGVIAELAHGFELSTNPADGRPWTIVVDRLSPKKPGFIAREVTFVKAITARKIKATVPSPALLGERMWDPAKSKGAYPTREAFVTDCIPILRREVELLAEAGADIVQIDDPHLCLFVDPEVRRQHADPDRAADFAVDAVNGVVKGIHGVRFAEHLCRRAGARARGEAGHAGGFDSIINQLNRLKVHHLTMEFTAPGAGDFDVLRKLREDLEIGLGCVDVTPGRIDAPDVIANRVRAAVRHISPRRITLNPDCGFAPGSGAQVGIDEAYTKLRNEVAAAEILRAEFG